MGNGGTWCESLRATRLQKYLDTPFDKLGMENRRRRVFEEQEFKCNGCANDTWRSEPIVLELEHKDGDNQNNARENLEGLCPNCHSQTPTWRGRNKVTTRIPDEGLLKDCIGKGMNIRQALIASGYSPSGANYETAKKILGP